MKYLVFSRNEIAFCEDTQAVREALTYRSSPECFIFSADEFDDLLSKAYILQRNLYYRAVDTSNVYQMTELPAVVTQSMFIQNCQPRITPQNDIKTLSTTIF